jgi:predicted AlkP superfamily phosphohydrolase/phosphomutase
MKCIVLGLDGASYSLVEDLIEDLPTLRRLRSDGAHGKLTSTILPNSLPAWPVICTGKNPGKLGVFDFMRKTAEHTFQSNIAADVKSEFVWEMLEDNGHKCGLINVPCSSPFRSDIEFGEGDFRYKDFVNFTWSDTSLGVIMTSNSLETRLEELIEERFRQIAYAFENREWDFLMMNINEVDVMSHHRWTDREFIRKLFMLIDCRLGELLELHPELNLMIISDHGMVEIEKRFWTMNWLEREGLLSQKVELVNASPLLTRKRAEKLINAATWISEKLHMRKLAVKYGRGLGRKLLRKGSYDDDIGFTEFLLMLDWERTVAYTHGNQGKIYLNGNHPSVLEDRAAVRQDVSRRLKDFCGNNGIELEIWTNDDLYHGPCSADGEDLVFIMDDNRILAQTYYSRDGRLLTEEKPQKFMSAHHHRTGIFFATGPDISRTTLEGATVFDITPTILKLFGYAIPADMDGRPLDIFRAEMGGKALGRKERIVGRIDF